MDSRPVPTPRRRLTKGGDQVDHATPRSSYENVQLPPQVTNGPPDVKQPKAENYENVELQADSTFAPKPAPRRRVSEPEHDTSPPKSTGAIRKAPQAPPLETRERRNSSNSTNSGASGDSSTFKTASPKDILKSLGATSKLLTVSISERFSTTRKSAVHKVEKSITNSRDKMETWTLEKTKKAQKKLKKLTSGKAKKDGGSIDSLDFVDNRRTVPANDPIFREISFTHPINNNSGAIEDLSRLSMYEVPKKLAVNEKLPSYDEVIGSEGPFKRNNLMSKSLMGLKPVTATITRNLSETNLNDIKESTDDSDVETFNLPPPKFPAPVLNEGIYGKVKKLNKVSADSDDEVVLRSYKPIDSNRGTFDVNEELPSLRSSFDKCESWSYMDPTIMLEEESSSPEPIYENNAKEEEVYEMIADMKTNLLMPDTILKQIPCSSEVQLRAAPEVLTEFDPLLVVDDKKNSLNIIENILNGDTYTNISLLHPIPGQLPMPPQRSDSLPVPESLPQQPTRKNKEKKKAQPQASVIIHQNLNLRSDSVEAIPEAEIDKYLAKIEEKPKSSEADLRHPKKATTTQWHVNNLLEEKLEKNVEIDPINTETSKAEKIKKIMIHNMPDDELPTYDEAIQNELFPSTSKDPMSFKAKFSNFLKINRRPSVKKFSDVKTIIEMIPRPAISEKCVTHSGNLLKLPSGPLEDILKELNPRYVDLRDQKLNTFSDGQMTQCKEHFPLKFVTSVQCVQSSKFNSESGVELHCFEINVAIPKLTANQLTSNPNVVLTSGSSGNLKTSKYSYIYGVHRKSERNNWMQKILTCFTDVFPDTYASEFTRAGWCYAKVS